ncbi:MAG TPA: hypothetical protein VFB21_04200, partial [Chthonomonadaceae bacterium]|nr:hypothetical protein [Chthonomonadaceae bacterium]
GDEIETFFNVALLNRTTLKNAAWKLAMRSVCLTERLLMPWIYRKLENEQSLVKRLSPSSVASVTSATNGCENACGGAIIKYMKNRNSDNIIFLQFS